MTDKNPYDRKLSDRFWYTLYGKSETGQRKLNESLHYAALTNKLWRAEFLLSEKGAQVNSGDGFCVRWAAESGHNEMIRLLARHGADMNAKDGEALLRACKRGFVDVAKTLMENGADPTRQNCASLRIADEAGDKALIRALLNAGHDMRETAEKLLEKAEASAQNDKAALYRQYLDAKASAAAMTAAPKKSKDNLKP